MKLREAIDRIDSLKHNVYSTEEKVEWLSRLDGLVKEQIIDTHEDGEEILYEPYTVGRDMDRQLLIPAPYDEVYIRWLEAQIDYYNGEIARYNNSMLMYQAAYDDFSRSYNRKHMPRGHSFKF